MKNSKLQNIKNTFSSFVNNKANKPKKDPLYGNKISGNVTFRHFILYAIIRGKHPDKVTHDKNSENYLNELAMIESLLLSDKNPVMKTRLFSAFISDDVTQEDITNISKTNLHSLFSKK